MSFGRTISRPSRTGPDTALPPLSSTDMGASGESTMKWYVRPGCKDNFDGVNAARLGSFGASSSAGFESVAASRFT